MTFNFLIHSPFPNYTGGRETWLYNVSKGLIQKGYEVNIFSYKNNMLPASFVLDGMHVHRVWTLSSLPFMNVMLRKYLRLIDELFFVFSMFISLRKHLRPGSTIITLGPVTDSLPVILLNKNPNRSIRLVCSVRGFHAAVLTVHFRLLKRLWYFLEMYGLRNAHLILCNGYDTLDYIKQKGFEAILMPNGVAFSRFNAIHAVLSNSEDIALFDERETVKIVSTATLLPIKGIREIIDAIPFILASTVKKFKVIWVGKGDIKHYTAYARQKGCHQHIVFLGEKQDTAPYLINADIVACLSGGGGFSMALLEAMASEKPIVAWDNNVYRMLLKHQVSGMLTKEKDAKALAETLIPMINNVMPYQQLGKEAAKTASQFDWKVIVEKVEQLP